jgi:hypothetical protein
MPVINTVIKNRLLVGVSLVAVACVLLLEPIPQPLSYHQFADRRSLAGIPNLFDVLSNLPFLLVGLAGLGQLAAGNLQADRGLRPAIALFFLGVVLTSFGSGYYHLHPDNASLVWDRLPMTLAFTGLVTLVVGEYVKVGTGRLLMWPLLLAGIGSVLWWHHTEQLGRGDLRFYGLVQFLPMLLLPLVLFLYPARWTRRGDYWRVGGWYLAAKLLEFIDRPLFDLTGVVSGHTLKHLAAAMAAWQLLCMLKGRVRLS